MSTPESTAQRRERLTAEHGKPEYIDPVDALSYASYRGLPHPEVTAAEVYAFIYRDMAAAEAWGEANLTQHGHPTLARVPLDDGRVIGIIDLRPALKRMREA